MVFITLVAAIINYQYGIKRSAGDAIAFFNTIYDPVHNFGFFGKSSVTSADLANLPGLALCDDGQNNCTLLPDYFPVHASWATTLHRRFTTGGITTDGITNCMKLYAHAWLNTTAFIICLIQMHQPTRQKYLELHRKMGWVAIVCITCGTGFSLWLSTDHGGEEYYGGNIAVAGWFVSKHVYVYLQLYIDTIPSLTFHILSSYAS